MKTRSENQVDEMSLFTAKGFSHGGRRVGAGRPKTSNKKNFSLWCTDDEFRQVKAFLERLRENEKEAGR